MDDLASGFRIDGITVKPMEGLITGAVGSVRVEPKAMAVLLELARHSGQVRSREQITSSVWPRGHTTDDTLTRCIGQLRKAFGENPRAPRILETIPRRGYRLLCPVEALPISATETETNWAANGSDMLIVLPFQYLSAVEDDYIADGLTELLIARLAMTRGLRVLSRTTAMAFKGTNASLREIAAKTRANWVVEGSILHSDDRLQVVVQLIDARTDAHIWADDYARDLGDLLLLQNDIADKIASTIRLHLNVDVGPTVSSRMLQAEGIREYLRGRSLISRRTSRALAAAIECFDTLIESSPDYAPAWASRAEARFMRCLYGDLSPVNAAPACRADVERALRLDPNLGLALAARGIVRFAFDRDMPGAEKDLLGALEHQPNYSAAMLSLGNVCSVQRRFPEATHWLEQALLVDPLDVGINMNFGDHLILQRRYPEAVDALQQAIQLAPGHRPSGLRLSWALALAGMKEAAQQQLSALGPTDTEDWQWQEYAALVFAATGARDQAESHWQQISAISARSEVSPWSMARAAVAAGQYQSALHWLDIAFAQVNPSLAFLPVTPAFDSLRGNPHFEALLSR